MLVPLFTIEQTALDLTVTATTTRPKVDVSITSRRVKATFVIVFRARKIGAINDLVSPTVVPAALVAAARQ